MQMPLFKENPQIQSYSNDTAAISLRFRRITSKDAVKTSKCGNSDQLLKYRTQINEGNLCFIYGMELLVFMQIDSN